MSSFARHTGLVAAGQAAVKATQLILAVVLVRLLDPASWNSTAFLLSIYLAATTIGTLNIQHGIVFFLPRVGQAEQRSLVLRTMGVLATVGAVIAALLTVAAPAITGGRLAAAEQLPWLGVAIAVELPATCLPLTLIALERYGAAAVWDLIGTAIVLAATIVPAASGSGVPGIVTGLIIAGTARSALGLWIVIRTLRGGVAVPSRVVWEQVAYAIPLGLTVAVSMFNRLVDKWFIAAFRPGDFGVYAVAAQEIPLLAVLPYAGGAALVTALVGAFAENDIATARTHWLHLTMSMSSFVVPIGVAFVLVAPELFPLVFTRDFDAGIVPFQLVTLVTLHRVAEYGMLLRAAGRTRALLQVATVTALSNAMLAGAGAYLFGMVGASAGTAVAGGIGWWYVMRRIAAVLEVPVRDAFAWRAWIACVMIAGGSALVTALVVDGLPIGPGGRLAVKVLLFASLFLALHYRWRRTPLAAAPAAIAVPEHRLARTGA